MNNQKSRAICILGMHRSGTSVITRAINLLGAYVGEQDELLPPKEDNPEGFWEFEEIVFLHEEILNTFGLTWNTSEILPAGWTRSPSIRPYRKRIKEIILDKFMDKPLWAWKDPRTCLLVPLWQEIMDELGIQLLYVVAFRNPLDVISSLEKRDGINRGYSENIWYSYTLSCIYDLLHKSDSRISFVHYDEFLLEPLKCLKDIHTELGLEKPFHLTTDDLNGVIRTNLRHSFTTFDSLAENQYISPDTVKLYGLCLELLKDRDIIKTDSFHQTIIELYQQLSNRKYKVQVFWKNEFLDLSEENSILIPLKGERLFHKYKFDLPSDSSFPIRIDPINTNSIFEISGITLTGILNGKEELIYSSSDDGFRNIEFMNGTLLNSSDTYVAITTDDPQIYLSIPKPTQDYISFRLEFELWVEFDFSLNTTDLINTAFVADKEKQEQLQLTLSELQIQLDQALQSNQQLHDEKVELSAELKSLQEIKSVISSQLEETTNNFQVEKESAIFLAGEVKQLMAHITSIENNIVRQNITLNEILNSMSWKITTPLRRGGSKIKGALKRTKNIWWVLTKKKFFLTLVPENELVSTDRGHWESTGNDPYFMLSGKFPLGWVTVQWTASADKELPLKLYWADSFGMSEEKSISLGVMTNQHMDYTSTIFLSPHAKSLRLDPGNDKAGFHLSNIVMKKNTRFHFVIKTLETYFKQNGLTFRTLLALLKKSLKIIRKFGYKGLWNVVINKSSQNKGSQEYESWLRKHLLTEDDKRSIQYRLTQFSYKPLISVVIPVYNVEEQWLLKCLDSVINQYYTNWELCISDDASTKPHIKRILDQYKDNDTRIKVVYRSHNGHISESSNSAIEMCTGEYVALLDHDDELTPDALFEVVSLLNEYPDADMIYSDEDKISPDGVRHSPFFKPDWSPETLLSQMYTCHLGVYRTSIVREIGGFRKGFEGSQDYDLVLRFTEKTDRVYHIPKILYHWRSIPQSTASGGIVKTYTSDAGYRALVEAVERRCLGGWVEPDSEISNLYIVHPRLEGNPLISIVIPTRNMGDILDKCLTSIFQKTSYSNYEVIVVDNGSDDKTTLELFEYWKQKEPFRFVVKRIDIPFNYSKLNNLAVGDARGELVLLLNNDTEIITPSWLEEMAAQAMRNEIGAVGACLLYPDNTLQHAGIILGIGGIAGHSHKYFQASDYGYFSRLRMVTNYAAVTAACLMVRKSVYEQVQGLDENLKIAFNDVDFCLRIRELGYRNVWLPQVKLYHHESKSRGHENTPEKVARFNSEVMYMQERWGSLLLRDPYYNPNLTLEHEDFSLSL